MISVIVPVYKVEQYLNQCVQSIVSQSYSNLEIILVDDGSPDNCPSMCDAWAAEDSRIKVIHKENGGAGSARNVGMSAITGNWFAFVDGDDYIAPWMYERMAVHITDDVDLIECAMENTSDDSFSFEKSQDGDILTMDAEQAMSAHLSDVIFRQTPPNKLYRTGTARGIPFPVGTLIDDEFWTYRVIGKARKLVHIPDVLYAYRQHDASAMHRSFSLKRLQMLDARCERLDYIRQHFPNLVSKAEIGLWGACLYSCQMAMLHLPPNECGIAINKTKKTLAQIPPNTGRFLSLSLSRKLWWIFSKITISGTCRLRNLLKIGI